jgi:hypothetical protein
MLDDLRHMRYNHVPLFEPQGLTILKHCSYIVIRACLASYQVAHFFWVLGLIPTLSVGKLSRTH